MKTQFVTLSLLIGITCAPMISCAEDNDKASDKSNATTGPVQPDEKKVTEVSDKYLALQVALDRAMFSPGAIDGQMGSNAENALKAFQLVHNLKATGKLDDETSAALVSASHLDAGLQPYTITAADANTHFLENLPKEMKDQAQLPALSYTSMAEMLGERFHSKASLIEHLNPDAKWTEGEVIQVPNVHPTWIRVTPKDKLDASAEKAGKDARKKTEEETDDKKSTPVLEKKPDGPVTIIVTKDDTSLTVLDKDGKVVFHAPVSAGSEHDPLPIGDWKVNGTEFYPEYSYNPELFWDAKKGDDKAKLPAGPNGPVGVAWIDINRPHFGLHGTPNPEKLGYTESHGCVRLANWDVLRLAAMVKPETKVHFREKTEVELLKGKFIPAETEKQEAGKSED